jgi:DASS family divalent anion:Na+ symporter
VSPPPTTSHPGLRLVACALLGLALYLLPAPAGLVGPDGRFFGPGESATVGATSLVAGWHVLAVFAAAVLGFVLRPFPMGAVTIFALTVLALTRTLTFERVLSGFADPTVWLVVAAFLIAGVVIRSGLGRRIALTLVVGLGRSTLGLGYALCASEMILGTVIPSNTARGGGVLAPIARALSEALGSKPHDRPERVGAYLMLVGAHANLIAAAMYLTGMAANPLVRDAARKVFGIEFGWGTWLAGSIVPALVSFAALPLVIGRLARPTMDDVAVARAAAREQLAAMGKFSRHERLTALVGAGLVALWATKPLHGLDTTLVAWMGIGALLILQVEDWQNLVRNDGAWDALIWVGGILTMATALRDLGVIGWFAWSVQAWVAPFSGVVVLVLLALVYFYSMYAFSMLTAHIAAMVAAFLAIAKTAMVAPLVVVALLAYFSNLCACLTPYSSGSVIIYFGNGYVSSHRWFVVGFVVSLVHLVVWLGVGGLWWKVLGWW